MSSASLLGRLKEIAFDAPPAPASGHTAQRHARLVEVGREDLSLGRLAEAHWDAVSILLEAGCEPAPGAIYGVWASEIPGSALVLSKAHDGWRVSGTRMFCSGAGLVDRALVTANAPVPQLVDVDLRTNRASIALDASSWKTWAFADTNTATVTFADVPIDESALIGAPGWYLDRPGFWHGACGPAAVWAGGSAGLVDYARKQKRRDAHTMAHFGAMTANVWAMRALLEKAGNEIDANPEDGDAARVRALTVRHLIEQAATDVLRRLTRAYGPRPLAMEEQISRRYQELDLYLRQSHAERDLEELADYAIRTPATHPARPDARS